MSRRASKIGAAQSPKRRYSIIVGSPNSLVSPIHDRMPVILLPEDFDLWLDDETAVDAARGLLKPYDPDLMKAYAVSRTVNNVRNDTEECIAPVEEGS